MDTELGGQEIKAGDKVVVFYSSANRDEDVFADPDSFDIGRDPNPHIGFGGGGAHFCLGNHLAKLETAGALRGRWPSGCRTWRRPAGPPAPLQLHQRHQGPSGHPHLTTGRDARTGPVIMPVLPEADPACSAALPHTHGTPGHDEHRAGDPPRVQKPGPPRGVPFRGTWTMVEVMREPRWGTPRPTATVVVSLVLMVVLSAIAPSPWSGGWKPTNAGSSLWFPTPTVCTRRPRRDSWSAVPSTCRYRGNSAPSWPWAPW